MLVRSKESKKSQQENNLNRAHSKEGQQRSAAAEDLQASVQGSLSDMVRQSPSGTLEDAQVADWLTGIRNQSPTPPPSYRNPKIFKRFVLRGGKLCQINGDSPS